MTLLSIFRAVVKPFICIFFSCHQQKDRYLEDRKSIGGVFFCTPLATEVRNLGRPCFFFARPCYFPCFVRIVFFHLFFHLAFLSPCFFLTLFFFARPCFVAFFFRIVFALFFCLFTVLPPSLPFFLASFFFRHSPPFIPLFFHSFLLFCCFVFNSLCSLIIASSIHFRKIANYGRVVSTALQVLTPRPLSSQESSRWSWVWAARQRWTRQGFSERAAEESGLLIGNGFEKSGMCERNPRQRAKTTWRD